MKTTLLTIALSFAFAIAPHAQSCSTGIDCGEGAYWSSAIPAAATPTDAVFYANAFAAPSGDFCKAINSALSTAQTLVQLLSGSHGMVVDARGLTDVGGTNCLTDPFHGIDVGGTDSILLLLGPINLRSKVTWVLPNRTRIVGDGATVISAVSGFAAGADAMDNHLDPAVVQFGDSATQAGTALFGDSIEQVTIDCAGNAMVGLRNQASQEQTTADRVVITNCKDTGLEITTSGAQNSGPFRNLQIVPGVGTYITTGTTCARVGTPQTSGCQGSPCFVNSFRGIEGMVCDNSSGTQINYGLDISTQGGRFRDIDILGTLNAGIRLGNSTAAATNGVVLENITGCVDASCSNGGTNYLSTLVLLAPASGTASGFSVSMRGLQLLGAPSGDFIVNDSIATPIKYCDQSVAIYDHGTGGSGGVRYTTAQKTSGC